MIAADELSAAIDAERGSMVELLSRLVAIPSENPPGREYDACVEALESAAAALGLRHERLDIASAPRRTALRAWVGDEGPVFYFHGHYDVVPAFSRDQFTPRTEGDAMFGRGTSDMKSGLVAMLYAARALRAIGAKLRGRIGLLFVPDEETGGANGSAALLARGDLAKDAVGMLLPEPTSGCVWHANRGAITLSVAVAGRAAHVGLEHQGTNALERAMPLLQRLFELKRALRERNGSILLVGGQLQTGTNFNVVPDRCQFTIDRRVNADEDFESERRQLIDLIAASVPGEGGVAVTTIQEGRAASTPVDHAVGRALAESVMAVTGELPHFEMCPGLLETRFYASRGVPAYAYGPGLLAVSHGPTEFVRLSRMIECAKIYALTAARVLQ